MLTNGKLEIDRRAIERTNGPPAMLLLGGLNLIRPIGRASIPVIVASPDPGSLSLSSRYCRGHLLLPDSPEPDDRTAAALMEAGAELAPKLGSRIPLFYGSDDTLDFVSRRRVELSRYYLFLLNEPELARMLIEKDQFDALTRERGLPVPRRLDWAEDGENSVGRASFPVIVKPTQKIAWHQSEMFRSLFGGAAKARVFRDGRELLADRDVRECKDRLIVQEYIPGGDEQIYSFHGFADERSEVLASFCGRKIRTFPKSVGESCYLELVHDAAVSEAGREIIRKLGFKGVFKIDLKRDPRNGRLYLLEINARFNLWHHLGAVAGLNLPQVAYEYLVTGRVSPQDQYSTRYRWVDLTLDRKAFRELRERREITLAGWLRSLLTPKVYDVFSWTDPAPALRWWRDTLKVKLLPHHLPER